MSMMALYPLLYHIPAKYKIGDHFEIFGHSLT